jgi:hypothetical protein
MNQSKIKIILLDENFFIKLSEKIYKNSFFGGYIFKDRMIESAVKECIKHIKNFDSTKCDPDKYFSVIVKQSFKKTIMEELNG